MEWVRQRESCTHQNEVPEMKSCLRFCPGILQLGDLWLINVLPTLPSQLCLLTWLQGALLCYRIALLLTRTHSLCANEGPYKSRHSSVKWWLGRHKVDHSTTHTWALWVHGTKWGRNVTLRMVKVKRRLLYFWTWTMYSTWEVKME